MGDLFNNMNSLNYRNGKKEKGNTSGLFFPMEKKREWKTTRRRTTVITKEEEEEEEEIEDVEEGVRKLSRKAFFNERLIEDYEKMRKEILKNYWSILNGVGIDRIDREQQQQQHQEKEEKQKEEQKKEQEEENTRKE